MFDDKPVISPASLRCDTVVSPSVDVAAMIEAYELSRCQGCEPAVIRMDEFPMSTPAEKLAAYEALDWGNPHNPSYELSPLHAEAYLRERAKADQTNAVLRQLRRARSE